MPIAFAAANSFTTKRCCISGSPPLMVNPPDMTFRPGWYFLSSSVALATLTGIPFVIVQVSGLWQYRHRHMQPVVQATTRTPGPSTADPVVNECRNPMSPDASALRTSVSGTFRPRSTRSSNGLFAARGVCTAVLWSDNWGVSVERPIDDVHLLLAREPHEVDRVAGHPNRESRIFLGVVHRIEERVAIEHVDVHVEAGGAEECVEHRRQVGDAIFGNA